MLPAAAAAAVVTEALAAFVLLPAPAEGAATPELPTCAWLAAPAVVLGGADWAAAAACTDAADATRARGGINALACAVAGAWLACAALSAAAAAEAAARARGGVSTGAVLSAAVVAGVVATPTAAGLWLGAAAAAAVATGLLLARGAALKPVALRTMSAAALTMFDRVLGSSWVAPPPGSAAVVTAEALLSALAVLTDCEASADERFLASLCTPLRS